MFYNGWTNDHYDANSFSFVPNGWVIYCVIYALANIYNSSIAYWGNVYLVLQHIYTKTDGEVVVNPAFARGDYRFFIESAQDEQEVDDVSTIIQCRHAASLRKAAECEMRVFQSTFLWIIHRIPDEERNERKLLLCCTVLLIDLRTRPVRINPILPSFMVALSVESSVFLQHTLL